MNASAPINMGRIFAGKQANSQGISFDRLHTEAITARELSRSKQVTLKAI